MFEKEAEDNKPPYAYCALDTKCELWKDGFQKGAEFGYNLAKEEIDYLNKHWGSEEERKANEWHYVKDEFPPENVPLNIITFDKDKKRRLWEGEYKGGNGQWWTGYFNHYIDVPYAWKEIVLPELPKESE
jgi:hypothetical protein